LLNVPVENVMEATEKTVVEWRERGKEVERLKEKVAEYETVKLLKNAESIGGVTFIKHSIRQGDVDFLIKIGDIITKKDAHTVIALCTVDKKVNLVVMAGEEAIRLGVNAGKVAYEMARTVGGGGGGRANLGQGGGTAVEKTSEALDVAKDVVKGQVLRE
jgi:alanyl-tRNA synthetase